MKTTNTDYVYQGGVYRVVPYSEAANPQEPCDSCAFFPDHQAPAWAPRAAACFDAPPCGRDFFREVA